MPPADYARGKDTLQELGVKLGPKFRIDENEDHDYDRWYFFPFTLASLSCLLADLNYYLLVSFFPKSAGKKGLKSGAVGLIFAAYMLSNFITSFFVPAYAKKYGGRHVMIVASACQALFVGCMAFTDYIHNGTVFMIVCIILRTLQGIAASSAEIACGGIAIRSAPSDQAAEAATYLDFFRLLGTSTGPVVGGVLYSLGGFKAPFLLSSSLLGCMALLYLLPMRKVIDNKSDESDDTRERSTLRKIWRLPVIIVLFVCLLCTSVGLTFVEPTVENFLGKQPFNLNQVEVGGIVSLVSIGFIFFGCASPLFFNIFGRLPVLALGSFLIGAAYFILAPAPEMKGPLSINAFLFQSSYNGSMALVIFGMSLIGCGCGLMVTPVNSLLLSETEYAGISLKESSDAIVSILNQAFTLGGFIGSFTSGNLVEAIGFRKSCTLFGYAIFLVSIPSMITLSYLMRNRDQAQTQNSPTSSDSDLEEPFLEEGRIGDTHVK